jgi:hypothetical protein
MAQKRRHYHNSKAIISKSLDPKVRKSPHDITLPFLLILPLPHLLIGQARWSPDC